MYIILKILIVILIIYTNIVKSVDINAVLFSDNGAFYAFTGMVNEFNNYSKNNNLDINIHLTALLQNNFTSTFTDYETFLDYLFTKKSNKYDLIAYDNVYKMRYGPHLLDLKNILPKEHIDMYMEGVSNQTCIYNDKIIGLQINIDVDFLYYHKNYLKTYNQKVPKTWDDLINVGKYILNEERKLNNTSLIGYNGFFLDSEGGTCSIYETIYSFRDSINSPFPGITSQKAIDALEKIKEVKNELSSGKISIFKCHLRLFIISIGSTLSIIPLLYYLINNFKVNVQIIVWINCHRKIFLSLFIIIDIIMNTLILIKPYTIENIIYNNKIFQTFLTLMNKDNDEKTENEIVNDLLEMANNKTVTTITTESSNCSNPESLLHKIYIKLLKNDNDNLIKYS
ncbi:hypothetical protein BCR32DRAFT_242070 [Anaeromyces robustus]|uniref:Periplasmic binding protein-like II n=1 Tax=Anaeromyces robustus TaxID=1754192 RepID=A0A1Y1XHA3_9FUNG|nr:hypothetical protein BCR32DRAFT_242070 [Anaeromyces robustus]|eukprot:ORX85072.1 hypothetical protein BCR32DRAFT_242070 [Anaeromyces robustus]